MARRVTVYLKTAATVHYEETRASPTVRAETGFLVVTDGYGHEHWYPAADVSKVETDPHPRGW